MQLLLNNGQVRVRQLAACALSVFSYVGLTAFRVSDAFVLFTAAPSMSICNVCLELAAAVATAVVPLRR